MLGGGEGGVFDRFGVPHLSLKANKYTLHKYGKAQLEAVSQLPEKWQ